MPSPTPKQEEAMREIVDREVERAYVCVLALEGIKDPAAYLETLRALADVSQEIKKLWTTRGEPDYDAKIFSRLDAALSALRKQEQP